LCRIFVEKPALPQKENSDCFKGEFAFTDLPTAIYMLFSAELADYAKALKPVTVEAGEEAVVTLSLKR
jgi:hypothetical protein